MNLPELIGTLRKWGTCRLPVIGHWVSYRSFTNKRPGPVYCTVIRSGRHVSYLPISAVAKIHTSGATGAGNGKPFKFLSLLEMVATLPHYTTLLEAR